MLSIALMVVLLTCCQIEYAIPSPTTASGTVGDASYSRSIVVTTIQHPTPSMKRLAELTDWKLIVVGDLKTPPDWHLDDVDFLSYDMQSTLPYEILRHRLVSSSSYARKNVGYLWAIQHGAKIIYETDDDNLLTSSEIAILASPGLYPVYNSSARAINTYAHFKQPTLWPRGFPLEDIKTIPPTSFVYDKARPLIQQYLANVDPDVDAIYRLTQKLGINFDSKAFHVVLPKGSFCPYNSQNTLFLQPALWAMLIPISTTNRVCDIWRGYWSQRLVWDINGSLAFATATVDQYRNSHNIFHDFVDEGDLYNKAGLLVDFLGNWESEAPSLPERMFDLAQSMADAGFWGQSDSMLMKAWVADLSAIGYEFPAIIDMSADPMQADVDTTEQLPLYQYPHAWTYLPTITLVVMLNKPYVGYQYVVQMLHDRYMSAFGRVVFTGLANPNDIAQGITWVPCEGAGGFLMHKCLAHVMETYRPELLHSGGGYLMIGDDTVFDLCKIRQLNTSRIWLPHARDRLAKKVGVHALQDWQHWEASVNGGRQVRIELLDAISSLSGAAHDSAAHQHLLHGNMANNTEFYDAIYTDALFIPNRLAPSFVYLAYHFSLHPVHHEVAIPNIVRLLTPDLEDVEQFHAVIGHLYNNLAHFNITQDFPDIMLPGGTLRNESVFLHPVKLSIPVVREHFCKWWQNAAC